MAELRVADAAATAAVLMAKYRELAKKSASVVASERIAFVPLMTDVDNCLVSLLTGATSTAAVGAPALGRDRKRLREDEQEEGGNEGEVQSGEVDILIKKLKQEDQGKKSQVTARRRDTLLAMIHYFALCGDTVIIGHTDNPNNTTAPAKAPSSTALFEVEEEDVIIAKIAVELCADAYWPQAKLMQHRQFKV